MNIHRKYVFFSACYALALAICIFILISVVSSLRLSRVELDILETRQRIMQLGQIEDHDINYASTQPILSKSQFFTVLANLSAASLKHGLLQSSFATSGINLYFYNGDNSIYETTIRINVSGYFDDVMDYLDYLTKSGVYFISVLSLHMTSVANANIELSIFHYL